MDKNYRIPRYVCSLVRQGSSLYNGMPKINSSDQACPVEQEYVYCTS
jgi:hypothetical protein